MDKVIIDGVDVSGCMFYEPKAQVMTCHEESITKRCDITNCYYKKLKRLQAEYDDLHLNYAGCKTANTGLQELNQKLQAENERMKEELRTEKVYSSQIEELEESLQHAKAENKELKEYKTSKENSYKNLQKEWQQLQWDVRKLTTENERLKEIEEEISDFISDISTCGFRYDYRCPDNLDELQQCIEDLCNKFDNYKQTLQEIREIAENGLQSICYKANCATCRCYSKKISNDTLENIINDYFDEDGDFTDTEGDFFEVLQAFIDRERVACNKAQPISEKILAKINEVIGGE